MTTQPRWRELAAAGHGGDEAVVRAALADDDPVARELALGALARLGVLADADLIAAFADPAAQVRRRAAQLAATHPTIDLLPLLRDADATVVEVGAWAAGEHEVVADEVLALLCELAVAADDALVREAAVAALGAIGDERGLPAILHGCADKPAIRRRAVLALAPFTGPEVDAALQAALADRDWQVRQAAEDIAASMQHDT
ncbi:MAG: HEAT repeat domain-containing protein [Actinomycetota bacterium]|nr:HEAT repeat domain-containing protein [Actinomycetota bacterium]